MLHDPTKWAEYVCPTCGKSFRKLLSQTTGRPFCTRQCHYNFQRPLADRFWEKVSKSDGCWLWTGQKTDKDGYGRIDERINRVRTVLLAHRVSWELHHGLIPDGMHVLHHCDNPPCVNPAHLFLGTQIDNNDDKIAKHRQTRGESFSHARLTEASVRIIRARYAGGSVTQQSLADEFHVSISQICNVVNRTTWRHVD